MFKLGFSASYVITTIITISWFARGGWKQKHVIEEIKLSDEISQETTIEEGLN